MQVLITGIAGFFGSRLAGWILQNVPDAVVVGIDDLSGGFRENIPDGAWWCRMSLGEGLNWPRHVGRPDLVFHCAAYAAEGLSPFIRRHNYVNNVVATAEVVNACLNWDVRRLVFLSSMAVYGEGNTPFREYDPPAPIDPYGVAKLACEQDIRIAGNQHGLDWCVIRPHNVFGPGQSLWDPYRNVLGIWMARHLEGLPLLIYGDGSQRRAFSWIDDCLPCLWRAATSLDAFRETINLGGDLPITIAEAADIVARVVGGARIEHAEARHEVRDAWCTTAKSRRVLGYRPSIPLEEALGRMWAWAQDVWPQTLIRRRQARRPKIEVQRGLYPFWRAAKGTGNRGEGTQGARAESEMGSLPLFSELVEDHRE